MFNRTKIMKKVFLSILSVLFISIAIHSCTKENSKESISAQTKKSTQAYYNPDTDPAPLQCCMTGQTAEGTFIDGDENKPKCPKLPGESFRFTCNEILLPNGDVIWQKAPVGGVLNVGDRIFDIEILTDKIVLLKFKDFYNTEYQNEFINRDFFDVKANTFFEEQVNIDGVNKKVKLLKGQYPIYLSTNPEFKAIVKINAELVD
jgi:hypothetical protein